MTMTPFVLLLILMVLALTFDFLNGFHDSANIVATMISSRAMTPRAALTIVAVAEFAGPFLLGVAIAKNSPANSATATMVSAARGVMAE